ncbi:MAG: DUF362 domain-containing protein [Myxococcales bacterium]|nr:DUF362 domain-containing protein [Myxococcales bacterium]
MLTSSSVPVAVISRPGVDYAPAPYGPPSAVYEMVEAAFSRLGLDGGRAGTAAWNPLSDVIQPGDRVVIKPNFVTNQNFHTRLTGEHLSCSSTHASVLRPIIDYALRAAGPRGRVSVVDSPAEGCNLDEVVRALGVRDLLADYRRRGFEIPLIDLRHFRIVPRMLLDNLQRAGRSWNLGLLQHERLDGDPLGYHVVDLAARSRFAEVHERAARLAFHRAHPRTPVSHHSDGRHEYSLPRTVLSADAIITVAKMKTHKKSGVTLALKSAIGLTNQKYWLPHYTRGTVEEGGDEYPLRPPALSRLRNQLQRVSLPPPFADHSLVARAPLVAQSAGITMDGFVVEGSWEGNDTLWRTTLDLCHALHYADHEGRLHDRPVRQHLALVDGIFASEGEGEGEGPLASTPKRAGLLVAGRDPVLVDHVATQIMGFDPQRVPTVREALRRPLLPTSDLAGLDTRQDGPLPDSPFVPPSTWPSLRMP